MVVINHFAHIHRHIMLTKTKNAMIIMTICLKWSISEVLTSRISFIFSWPVVRVWIFTLMSAWNYWREGVSCSSCLTGDESGLTGY